MKKADLKHRIILIVDYDLKHLEPAQELAKSIDKKLSEAIYQLGTVLNSSVSLDMDKVTIEIGCYNCDDAFKAIRPLLDESCVNVPASIELRYGAELDCKSIAIDYHLGKEYKGINYDEVEKVRALLARKMPKHHEFVMVVFPSNGRELRFFTEKEDLQMEDVMKKYKMIAANIERYS